jgi:hypothetical protein
MSSWLQARDQQGWGFATMNKGLPFQVKVFSFNFKHMPYVSDNIYLCMHSVKRNSLCRLKINHVLGFNSCVYSW